MLRAVVIAKTLYRWWIGRPRYKLSELPPWLLIVICSAMASATSYFAWVLSRVLPAYFEAAAQAKEFDALGLSLGVAVLGVA